MYISKTLMHFYNISKINYIRRKKRPLFVSKADLWKVKKLIPLHKRKWFKDLH